eukprot:CAMPEP_0195262180 /NCGR_PEP_ID=MMETSP0706-20130129/9609_1 /TAXON_ID=33640 /ORGANISM="Asterionellopsis glacialis, Strain CCMP134" /LENGTH=122 /DNA_ID=CAMNT_0040316227 /DNA_START=270 /DNA_END=635 /DNA_ORIENTATION=-
MTEAINLARRLSVRNENDLLQESYTEDDDNSSPPTSPFHSKDICHAMMNRLRAHETLPTECLQFPDLVSSLKRRNSNKSDHAKAFDGMSAKEASAAMAAREKGHLSHAQIQRRLTSSNSGRW